MELSGLLNKKFLNYRLSPHARDWEKSEEFYLLSLVLLKARYDHMIWKHGAHE